ncbi:MAG: UvrD-helicase domain-containing protein [Vampirovibrio sp.]
MPPTWIDQLLQGRTSHYHGELARYVHNTLSLNPEQADACFTAKDTPLQVLAGAGTGKTLLIAARYLTLLHELLETGTPQAESRILVMTFTKKAAGEMKERIHHHLKEAGYTGALPDENITTFNRFGQGFLKRHAEAAGLRQDVWVLDELDQSVIQTAVMERILKGQAHNLEQTLARFGLWDKNAPPDASISKNVLSPQEFKTWGRHQDPDAFLAAVWSIIQKAKSYGLTPKAFRDLARQQSRAFTQQIKTLPTGDGDFTHVRELYHAWAHHLEGVSTPAWQADLSALGEWDRQAYQAVLAYKLFKEHPAIDFKRAPLLGAVLPPDAWDWSSLDAHSAEELRVIDLITAQYAMYQERLLLDGAIDYDDQINLTLQTLKEHDDLRQKYQDWFEAVMVDEFQDTNGSQLDLLKCLMRHPEYDPEHKKNKPSQDANLTVVGDVKQSIYSFRFAQKENVSLIFEGLSPKRVALVRNYRSRSGILHVANQMADATAETTATRDPHLKAFHPSDPKVPTEVTTYYFGTRDETGKIQESAGQQKEHAFQSVVYHLLNDYATHTTHTPPSDAPYAWRDICILGRSHSQLSALASLLEAKNIPYLIDRDASLFQHPMIQNVIAFLHAVENPHQALWIVKLLSSLVAPLRLLHAVEAAHALTTQSFQSTASPVPAPRPFLPAFLEALFQQAELPPATKETINTLASAILQAHQHQRLEAPLNLLRQWQPVLLALSAVAGPSAESPRKAQERFLAFADLCQRHYERLGKGYRLSQLFKALERDQANPQFSLPLNQMRSLNQVNALRLMTFHAAKGLEFPQVHVLWFGKSPPNQAGMTFDPQFKPKTGVGLMLHKTSSTPAKDVLPYQLYKALWQNPRQDFENRRLAYVALTRAKHRLYFYVDASQLDKAPWLKLQENQNAPEQVQIQEEALEPEAFQARYDAFQKSLPLNTEDSLAEAFEGELPWPSRFVYPTSEQKASTPPTPTLPTHLSFSALVELDQCAVKYWLKYVKGIPTPPPLKDQATLNPVERAAIRGQLLHRYIETYYRYAPFTEATLLRERLEEVTAQSLGALEHENQAQIQAEAFAMYTQFQASDFSLERLHEKGYRILAPEQVIEFRLSPQHTGGQWSPVVKGQVDAIVYHRPTDTYGLLDFKTNRRLEGAKLEQYYEQMALYRLGFQINNPHVTVEAMQCELVHLPYGHATERLPLPKAFHHSTQASPWLQAKIKALEALWQNPEGEPPVTTAPPCVFCVYAPTCHHAQAEKIL